MTIDKAIVTLECDLLDKVMPHNRGVREAEQLGIEALKREQLLRREVPYDREGLLPGETEE
ncbi:unnamed protein product [marine sediment metagenome]|uniref:Uncharacterized protein n=1 Tax=marine sediment metagenome TaxID=412755 RepID=X1N2H4_9ZZZZ